MSAMLTALLTWQPRFLLPDHQILAIIMKLKQRMSYHQYFLTGLNTGLDTGEMRGRLLFFALSSSSSSSSSSSILDYVVIGIVIALYLSVCQYCIPALLRQA